MQIVLVLLLLAMVAVLVLTGAFVVSLIIGVVLSRLPRAKLFAPIFLLIIPSAAVGALTGGIVIGYFAVQYDDHLIFLGPLGGSMIGAGIGLIVGATLATIWWLRRKTRQQLPSGHADEPAR